MTVADVPALTRIFQHIFSSSIFTSCFGVCMFVIIYRLTYEWCVQYIFDTYSSKLQFNENKIKMNRIFFFLSIWMVEIGRKRLYFCPFVRTDRIEHHQFCMVWRQTIVDSIKIARKNVRVCVLLKFECFVSLQDRFICWIEWLQSKATFSRPKIAFCCSIWRCDRILSLNKHYFFIL